MATYYSNGKLFLLGEYYVLEGAKVISLPTKFGQYLDVFPINSPVISWKSYDVNGALWYNDSIDIDEIIYKKNDSEQDKIRKNLIDILHQAHLQNPNILSYRKGFVVETRLTFSRFWGLGTSSTLINNIAQWFEIDAFELLEKSFGGSGYDIANAQHNTPITFSKKNGVIDVKEVDFAPDYKKHIYYVYLNQKMDSKKAIENFRSKKQTISTQIEQVNTWTQQIVNGVDFKTFQNIITEYEKQLSSVLETETIQQQLFPDFNGIIKSLGGWGGDFVMVVSENNPKKYFESKGYNTIFTYDEMILSK